MKKVTTFFRVLAFSIFMTVSVPVLAQNDNSTTSSQAADDDDGDGDEGKWGLLGLLGLIGLAGLKRRDDDRDRRTTVNR